MSLLAHDRRLKSRERKVKLKKTATSVDTAVCRWQTIQCGTRTWLPSIDFLPTDASAAADRLSTVPAVESKNMLEVGIGGSEIENSREIKSQSMV